MPSHTTYVPSLDAEAPVVSVDGLVHWLRTTPATVAQLRNAGVLTPWRTGDGEIVGDRFSLFEAVGGYLAHLRAKLKQKPSSELQEARLASIRAQTLAWDLSNEFRKGQLLVASDVDQVVAEMHVMVRNQLMGLGPAVCHLLAGKEDPAEICRVITENVERILRGLKPVDREAIQARNRKLRAYSDSLGVGSLDKGGKVRPRNRSPKGGALNSEPRKI
jgi:hypothetical protein